jgi:hypothetical protein
VCLDFAKYVLVLGPAALVPIIIRSLGRPDSNPWAGLTEVSMEGGASKKVADRRRKALPTNSVTALLVRVKENLSLLPIVGKV